MPLLVLRLPHLANTGRSRADSQLIGVDPATPVYCVPLYSLGCIRSVGTVCTVYLVILGGI